MDKKFLEDMKHYYKLKQQYEVSIQKEKINIMKKNMLSKREKRKRFTKLQHKCINCKKPGGTIFTNTNATLKAVCGSSDPCDLNIELFKSRFINSEEEFRLYSSDLDKYKTNIIMTKLDFLFGYKTEDETLAVFEKSRDKIAKITGIIARIENNINDIKNNKEKEKTLNTIEETFEDDKYNLKNIYKEYLTEKKPEMIKDMVELYLTKLKPEAEEIRKLKYMYTGIEKDEDIYTLIEEPYTLDKMEMSDEKSVIVSYTF